MGNQAAKRATTPAEGPVPTQCVACNRWCATTENDEGFDRRLCDACAKGGCVKRCAKKDKRATGMMRGASVAEKDLKQTVPGCEDYWTWRGVSHCIEEHCPDNPKVDLKELPPSLPPHQKKMIRGRDFLRQWGPKDDEEKELCAQACLASANEYTSLDIARNLDVVRPATAPPLTQPEKDPEYVLAGRVEPRRGIPPLRAPFEWWKTAEGRAQVGQAAKAPPAKVGLKGGGAQRRAAWQALWGAYVDACAGQRPVGPR